LSLGSFHGVVFASRRIDAIAVRFEQALDAISGLLDIVSHQDHRWAVLPFVRHGTP